MPAQHTMGGFCLSRVVKRSANRGEALRAGDDHTVVAAGAMHDQQLAVRVPASDDADVFIAGGNTRSPGRVSSHEIGVQ